MKTLMAILSCSSCSPTLIRHWPYFLRQRADHYRIITTTSSCDIPDNVLPIIIGEDRYIDGPHLPNRVLNTIDSMLGLALDWDVLILCEYDCLFFTSIKAEGVGTLAGHRAGGKTWGSKAEGYYHNPWVFRKDTAAAFLTAGRQAIRDGICPERGSGQPSTPECSPDVFFGYVAEALGLTVQSDLWRQYSRNSFDIPGHLEEAREAYRNGVDVIHGIKTQEQLDFLLS